MKLLSILLFTLFISPTAERHFFVSYSIDTDHMRVVGNCSFHTQDNNLPQKKKIVEWYKKEYPNMSFEYKQFVIMGLYEFKSKRECDNFLKQQQ